MEAAPVRHSGNNFDFMRFVAASLVIVTHSYSLIGRSADEPLDRLTGGTLMFSHLAVDIFFIISGYLIAQSLTTSRSYLSYIWKRLLRIMPGLITVLLLLVFVMGPIVTTLSLREYLSSAQTYSVLISTSLYVLYQRLPGVFETNLEKTVDGSLWTLSYEFSCYIVLMIIFALGLFRRRVLILIVWILVFILRAYLGNKLYDYDKSQPFLLNHCITYIIEWGLYFGAGTLYFLYKDVIRFNVWIFLAVTALMVVSLALSVRVGLATYYISLPYMVFYLGFLPGPLHRFGRYGDFSYGIYIYAVPIQQMIIYYAHGRLGPLPIMVSTFLCTLPFAVLSWHLVEKRALQFKNYIK